MSKAHALDAVKLNADRIARTLVPGGARAKMLGWILGALFAVVMISLVVLPWQQTAMGRGRVMAYAPIERQQPIEAPIEGRIARIHIREGSHVEANELLIEMTDNDPEILQRLRLERDALVARAAAADARATAIDGRSDSVSRAWQSALQAADHRIRMARDRVRAAQQSLAAAQAAQRTALLNAERQRALVREGLASTRTVELATLDQLRTDTEVARTRAALDMATSEVEAITADRARASSDGQASLNDVRATRASIDAERAAAAAELVRIDVRLARQSTMMVRAPRAGTVLRISANPGSEVVKAGDPLLVFVPDTDARAVELWIDGNDVPLMQEGRSVRVQFEGWPAVQFSGWPSASVGTFGGIVSVIDATDNGRGKFRVVVVPAPNEPSWPSGRHLRQGVRANGWVLLNRVSLGYELWRRFNGFPLTVTPNEAATYGSSTGSSGSGGSYGSGGRP